MSDHLPWLQERGYADAEVENAVVWTRDLEGGARATARLDAGYWSVSSYALRRDETTISFVISGIADDQLQAKLDGCEAQLAWLYEQFQGR